MRHNRGLFQSCSMVRNSTSFSSEPVGPMLSIRASALSLLDRHFNLAFRLRKGDRRYAMADPHRDRKLEDSEAVNSGHYQGFQGRENVEHLAKTGNDASSSE